MVASHPRDLVAFGNAFRAHLISDGLIRLSRTVFRTGSIPGATKRTLAATSTDGMVIILSPKLALEPLDIRKGIVMHELGHAVDFLYPAGVVLGRGPDSRELVIDDIRAPSRRDISRWKRRTDDEIERFADTIAERAFDVTIGYRGPCLLQTTAGGVRPRPAGLR